MSLGHSHVHVTFIHGNGVSSDVTSYMPYMYQ